MTIQHHYFERDGHRLHYEIEAPAGVAVDAPLALILPGFWRRAGAPVFMPLTAAFAARGLRTLRMDMRGHGESEGIYQFGNIEAGDVAALLADLWNNGESPAVIWGLSMGGTTAVLALHELMAATHWPESLREVVLISAPIGRPSLKLHWFSPATLKQLRVEEAVRPPRFELKKFPKRDWVEAAAKILGPELERRAVKLHAFHCTQDWLIDVKLGRALYQALGPHCKSRYFDDKRRLHADALMRMHLQEMLAEVEK